MFDSFMGISLVVTAVAVLLIVILLFVRSRNHQTEEEEATRNRPVQRRTTPPAHAPAVKNGDLASYIQSARIKESEAWTNVMTRMSEDEKNLRTAYMSTQHPLGVPTEHLSSSDENALTLPITELQKVFFNFWKIPQNKIPGTQMAAERFIEAYKVKLRNDGYGHRVRRWGRLEIMLGRFDRQYDIDAMNAKCQEIGINRSVMDIFLIVVMSLLSKELLQWRDIADRQSYQIVLKYLNANYPQLNLHHYKF